MSISTVPNAALSPSAAPAGQKTSGITHHLAERLAFIGQCSLSYNPQNHTRAHRDLLMCPGQTSSSAMGARLRIPTKSRAAREAYNEQHAEDTCATKVGMGIENAAHRYREWVQEWTLHTSAAHAEQHAASICRCGCQEASAGAPGHSCHAAAVAFPDEASRPAVVSLQASRNA